VEEIGPKRADKTNMEQDNMSKKIEELRSKIESLKKVGTILKVANLEGKAFVLDVSATSIVNGQYGEQLMIVGTYEEGELDLKKGDDARIYLNNKRRATFEEAWIEEGHYAFVFGTSVPLKSGHSYIPLELVSPYE